MLTPPQNQKKASRYWENTTGSTTIDYCANFGSVDGNLEYILMPEGRILVEGTTYKYEYHLKDHLGNTRCVFIDIDNDGVIETANSEVTQVADYYPFGMKHANASLPNDATQRYLYNGKELQEGTDWLDYGARMYDPAIGRWFVIDPLCEWDYKNSPFVYCHNNPVAFIDPFGLADTLGTVEYPIPIAEVTVTAQKPGWLKNLLSKVTKWFLSGDPTDNWVMGNSTYLTGSTDSWTSENGQGQENAQSKYPHEVIQENIDAILSAAGSMKSSLKYNPNPSRVENVAKGVSKTVKAVQTAQGTSDKQIQKENSKNNKPTDAQGRTIEYWINRTNDTLRLRGGSMNINGKYAPGDTILEDHVKSVDNNSVIIEERTIHNP